MSPRARHAGTVAAALPAHAFAGRLSAILRHLVSASCRAVLIDMRLLSLARSPAIAFPFLVPHRFMALQEGYMCLWLARIADTIPTYAPAYYQVDKLIARARRSPYFTG